VNARTLERSISQLKRHGQVLKTFWELHLLLVPEPGATAGAVRVLQCAGPPHTD
jgi:hypothetical protein